MVEQKKVKKSLELRVGNSRILDRHHGVASMVAYTGMPDEQTFFLELWQVDQAKKSEPKEFSYAVGTASVKLAGLTLNVDEVTPQYLKLTYVNQL